MPSQNPFHLFAILQGKSEIRRLPLQQSLQEPLAALFGAQEASFLPPNAEVLAFDPALKPAEDQIIQIPNFEVPAPIHAALEDPLAVDPLTFSVSAAEQIVGLFTGRLQPEAQVLLQSFNRRQMLTTKGVSIVLSGNTFKQLNEPGLTLDDKLAAVIRDGNLFLRSYNQAARVLDLTAYYREATDEEVIEFVKHERFHCDDIDGLKAAADTWVRRKVAVLAKSEVLKRVKAKKVQEVAKGFKLDVVVKKVSGKDRIVLPQDRQELKNLLRFLDEDYYHSALTSALFVSHSKQKLAAKSA